MVIPRLLAIVVALSVACAVASACFLQEDCAEIGACACTADAECAFVSLDPCQSAVCDQGLCRVRPAAEGTACGQDASVCDGAGTCKKSDGLSCAQADECLSGNCCDGVCGDCSTGEPLWALSFGDAAAQEGVAVVAAPNGDVVIGGTFEGVVDLGGGALQSAGGEDVVLARLDADGGHLWSKRFGDANIQRLAAAACDADSNVLLAGEFSGGIDLGGGPLQSGGALDVFVAKLDPNGGHVWSQRLGGSGNQHAAGIALAGQEALVVGSFDGSPDFGMSAGGLDVFVARMGASGAPTWIEIYGGIGDQTARAVAADPEGRAVVVGSFEDDLDFGDGVLTSAGLEDAFVAVLDPSGTAPWSQRFGDANAQQALGVAAAVDGIVLVGTFSGNLNFGGGSLASAGGDDVFVAALTLDGDYRWHARAGDATDQMALGVALDGDGNAIVVGGFEGTLDFGTKALDSGGGEDVFAAKLDASGSLAWLRSFGDAGVTQRAAAVGVTAKGGVLLAGGFDGKLDFGVGKPLVSQGETDGFVALLAR